MCFTFSIDVGVCVGICSVGVGEKMLLIIYQKGTYQLKSRKQIEEEKEIILIGDN